MNELMQARKTMSGTEVSSESEGGYSRSNSRKKSRLWSVLAVALSLVLAACGAPAEPAGSDADSASSAASSVTSSSENAQSSVAAAEGAWKVGIAQLVQHPALDAATQGFQDALTEELGDQVTFDLQNASGDTTTVATIINGFVAQDVDLILANATAPLQSAAAATSTIPVLGTSITDYASALELADFTGTIGTNVSGTTDLSPFDTQVQVFQDWFPEAADVTIGILYASSEANSVYQVDEMTKRLEAAGYTVSPYSFTDSNDVAQVATQAVAESDVLYLPTDNVVASNIEAVANIVLPASKPVVAAFEDGAKALGVAAVSVDYYELGQTTGKMAAKVLRGEANIAEMPIESVPNPKKLVNAKQAAALGLEVPEGYEVIPGTEN